MLQANARAWPSNQSKHSVSYVTSIVIITCLHYLCYKSVMDMYLLHGRKNTLMNPQLHAIRTCGNSGSAYAWLQCTAAFGLPTSLWYYKRRFGWCRGGGGAPILAIPLYMLPVSVSLCPTDTANKYKAQRSHTERGTTEVHNTQSSPFPHPLTM